MARRPATAVRPAIGVLVAATLAVAACGPSRQEVAAEQRATLARYCFECHDDAEREADLSLESLDFNRVGPEAATWEHVVRKLQAGMMPPHDGGPRPTAEETAGVLSWLESELDRTAAEAPNPGRTVPFHRLNRSEYRNAVRDLTAVDVDVASLLPGDDASYGFDNIGGVLKLSPTLLERYLAAADKISRLAVGTASPFVTIDSFRIPDDRSQERRLPGMPFGTRGGFRIDYTFPQDAEYEISAALARDLNEGMPIYTTASASRRSRWRPRSRSRPAPTRSPTTSAGGSTGGSPARSSNRVIAPTRTGACAYPSRRGAVR